MTNNQINSLHLHAVNLASEKKGARERLKGVLIEQFAEGTRLIATDGYRLFLLNEGNCAGEVLASALLHNDFIKLLPKKDAVLTYSIDLKSITLGLEGEVKHVFPLIGEVFPDYRRLILPEENYTESNEAVACLDAAYLGDYAKVAKLLGCPPAIKIESPKEFGEPCRITFSRMKQSFFTSVLMQMKF